MKATLKRAVVVVIWLVGLTGAWAIFVEPPEVDVERLLRNTAAYVAEHPSDAQGYYVLARVNSLAYALKTKTLRAFEKSPGQKKKLPVVSETPVTTFLQGPKQSAPPAERLTKHLSEAIANFDKAIDLSPDEALYYLGLGCVLDAGAKQPGSVQPWRESPKLTEAQRQDLEAQAGKLADADSKVRESAQQVLIAQGDSALAVLAKYAVSKETEMQARAKRIVERIWKEKAMVAYLKAYRLAIDMDLMIPERPLEGLRGLVGYEAGTSYLHLLQERPATENEKAIADEVRRNIESLERKPSGPVTPIIFALDPVSGQQLSNLLAPETTVRFDLDGDGAVETWSWVKPDTGILVWDPRDTGNITSGRQLFGSVTWWMFWNNGYHALDALDDNRDGQLTGDELAGLGVWRDRNSNGSAEPCEVMPVSTLGIAAISVRVTHHDGKAPASSLGVRFNDGRVMPTFDWIATPHFPPDTLP